MFVFNSMGFVTTFAIVDLEDFPVEPADVTKIFIMPQMIPKMAGKNWREPRSGGPCRPGAQTEVAAATRAGQKPKPLRINHHNH